MNKWLRFFISSAMAALIFAFASFELVAMDSLNYYVVGAFLQGFGLLLVLYFDLTLFNCKLCEVFKNKCALTVIKLVLALIINVSLLIGFAYLFRLISNENQAFIDSAIKFTSKRMISVNGSEGKAWYMALFSGLFCGIICYVSSYLFKNSNHVAVKIIAPFFGVGLYVILGLENLMTNVFYISFAHMLSLSTALDLILVCIGNVLGVYFMYLIFWFLKKQK